jgi:putative membrane protein
MQTKAVSLLKMLKIKKEENTMRSALLPVALLFVPHAAFADPYSHMGDWGYSYGMGMMFGPVIWVVTLGLVVAGVIWFVRQLDGAPTRPVRSDALNELDLRLARGEIDIEEHAAKRKALSA